ncbi:hypothetical protein KZZ52_44910 [Dactylosporangium sp. AC04546]|uniref:hypothetical protein n=1 Tax=Dactylosporangium sp. AC04546 TaxID=2862460 RepID=UPI001EDD7260|nr:hypothetical protein [Dactylosporangium sp. AC04546]WVK81058.1 hypothetical protein KZZ52_44910 [Dactylosporangium sp. AC04546]
MRGPNDALAAVLERGRAADEADALLAALVDGGVYVPFDEQGSVVFIGVDDTGPVLPGYTSEAACERWLPHAAGSLLCDVLRLLDIAEHTGVGTLAVFAAQEWAKVPLPLVASTLRGRGMRTQGEQTLRLTWSTHPMAVALRGAFAARILAHPQVRTVWIAHARWIVSGNEQLMVHVAVDEEARPAGKALLEAVLAEEVPLGPESPSLALRVLEPHEAHHAAELDGLGLDTIRADHAAGQVHVVSHEFDGTHGL